jgi:glycosyltransferase involved in cell wall biosynthesis
MLSFKTADAKNRVPTNRNIKMPKMLYISLARFPTEKAHGLQIAQNCEAFVQAGYELELWVSKRQNSPEMLSISDPFAHYGVKPNFKLGRIAGIDLFPLMGGNAKLERIGFYLHMLSFCLLLLWRLRKEKADIYYSRDEYVLLALSLIIPREKLVFEVHQFSPTRMGAWLEKQLAKRVGHIVAITQKLKDDYVKERGSSPDRVLVAHDGVREARFANLPNKAEARQRVGWSDDAFIVGFMGRLQMLNTLEKGVGTLVEALASVEGASLAIVGGPDDAVEALRREWLKLGLPAERFLYAGQVAPELVPVYLRAFDVCAMPHPFNPQFAYYTSPLKLFEYMAAEGAIVASDLPAWADVVENEKNALLVPPSDSRALAHAIQRLKDSPELREQLGKVARETVMQHYTWAARAVLIRRHLDRDIMNRNEFSEVHHGN